LRALNAVVRGERTAIGVGRTFSDFFTHARTNTAMRKVASLNNLFEHQTSRDKQNLDTESRVRGQRGGYSATLTVDGRRVQVSHCSHVGVFLRTVVLVAFFELPSAPDGGASFIFSTESGAKCSKVSFKMLRQLCATAKSRMNMTQKGWPLKKNDTRVCETSDFLFYTTIDRFRDLKEALDVVTTTLARGAGKRLQVEML
jgi:hypothetical protein